MNNTLENHTRGYNISFRDVFISAITGLSGIPYSERHWQLAKVDKSQNIWGHRIIAMLQAIPIVGVLAALIERIIVLTIHKFSTSDPSKDSPSLKRRIQVHSQMSPISNKTLLHSSSTTDAMIPSIPAQDQLSTMSPPNNRQTRYSPPPLIRDNTKTKIPPIVINTPKGKTNFRKMWENSQKAILEHAKKDPQTYASLKEALPSIKSIEDDQPTSPLNLTHVAAAAQGRRSQMEDAHFFKEIEQGTILGVLDGHGGVEVAEFTSKMFQERFSETLKATDGQVYAAFNTLITEIHKEVLEHKEWDLMGTTAVICFIDKQTHRIYTATLGDSEANLYRKIDGESRKSIPISCVRDFTSQKDAARAAKFMGIPEIEKTWPTFVNAKSIRLWSSDGRSINVSRAIGDKAFIGTVEKPGVIQKPKNTVNLLQAGDVLILACDGLKDYVPEHDIAKLVNDHASDPNVAQTLVNYALQTKSSRDNVTVLAVKVS